MTRALRLRPTSCVLWPVRAESGRGLPGIYTKVLHQNGVKWIHVGIINIIGIFLFSSSTSEIYKIKLIY